MGDLGGAQGHLDWVSGTPGMFSHWSTGEGNKFPSVDRVATGLPLTEIGQLAGSGNLKHLTPRMETRSFTAQCTMHNMTKTHKLALSIFRETSYHRSRILGSVPMWFIRQAPSQVRVGQLHSYASPALLPGRERKM